MNILSSPHCHTTFVDGKSTASEMARAAYEKGFVSMGFSEHGTQPFDAKYCLAEEMVKPYIDNIRALAAEYSGKMRIHLGIERDMYSTARREDYDYVLGACHYFLHEGGRYAVDGSFDDLARYREARYNGDGALMAVEYFDMCGDYALEYKPDIFAHFDLIKKNNAGGRLYDPDDPRVTRAQRTALEKILASGAFMELNTGGMARSGQERPYPEHELLRIWRDMGGRVIVGSDCHFAPQIDFAFDMMGEYLTSAGYRTIWRLGAEGEAQFAEQGLD